MTDRSNGCAAVAGYMLLRWRVDSSPEHRLKNEQYCLWFSVPLALYGVENTKLAPGYQAPSGQRNDREEQPQWPRHLKPTTS